MKLLLYANADFGAVYLVNGVFRERIEGAAIERDEALFVTVLPLSAALLPYTVKLVGGKVRSNCELARAVTVEGVGVLLRLTPRYNYVYSPEPRPPLSGPGEPIVKRFFAAVKCGDLPAARACMTDSLSAAVSDEALVGFFADYTDVIDCSGIAAFPPSCTLLVRPDDHAHPFVLSIDRDLIDDISDFRR